MPAPLANFFAFHDPDFARLKKMERELGGSNLFQDIWLPVPNWVAGIAPQAGSLVENPELRRALMIFAEGQDSIREEDGGDQQVFWNRLADIADDSSTRLGEYPGDFTFIRFHPGGRATVARACAGLAPIYYWKRGPQFAVATSLEFI